MNVNKESGNCPYCLSPIEEQEEKVRCPKCGVTHHAECWRTNGKCSVYGCDGWVLWNEAITSKLVPETQETVDVSTAEHAPVEREQHLCIDCGAPVKPGRLKCFNCMRRSKRYLFENCLGPSVIMLGAAIGVVTLLVRTLT